LKKKTPNTVYPPWRERRTPNAEFRGSLLLLNELSASEYSAKRGKYDLEDRLLELAVQIVELTEALPDTRALNHIAGQLLRSGTSPYGNHGELESAESRRDFVHKLRICLKELRETRRWLRLVARLKKRETPPTLSKCLNESEELIRIFAVSVRTAERNSA
jgi:four helix bundle protein